MASIIDQTTPVPASDRLKLLQGFFGVPADTGGDGTLDPTANDANAPVLAAALHSQRTQDLEDQAARGDRVARARLPQMQAEDAGDPYSDPNVSARDLAQQKAADAVAAFLSPGAEQVRGRQRSEAADLAGQTAYAKGLGGAEAGMSDPAQEAADAASRRKIAETQAMMGVKNATNLSQQERQTLDTANSVANLGMPLLEKFKAQYPGIDEDPTKYASPISDMLTAKVGKGWYSLGGMTDNDAIMQETGAIQAWLMRGLVAGRVNKQMMDIINAHLPQPGFSPGANYDRLNRLLTEVVPSLGQGVGASHLPFDPSNPMANYSGPGGGLSQGSGLPLNGGYPGLPVSQ